MKNYSPHFIFEEVVHLSLILASGLIFQNIINNIELLNKIYLKWSLNFFAEDNFISINIFIISLSGIIISYLLHLLFISIFHKKNNNRYSKIQLYIKSTLVALFLLFITLGLINSTLFIINPLIFIIIYFLDFFSKSIQKRSLIDNILKIHPSK